MRKFKLVLAATFVPLAIAAAVSVCRAQAPVPVACPTVDGKLDDWARLKPLYTDPAEKFDPPAADIRAVYAATCDGWVYGAIVVDGRADAATNVEYDVLTDDNHDRQSTWQFGFGKRGGWLWDESGAGFSDPNNFRFLNAEEYKLSIGEVVEFAFPVKMVDSAGAPNIETYTYIVKDGKSTRANACTGQWTTVPSFADQLSGKITRAPHPRESVPLFSNKPAVIIGSVSLVIIAGLVAAVIFLWKKSKPGKKP